jgi:hypothetical protein
LVKEIKIYIEGGGDSDTIKTKLREGFTGFLQPLIAMGRDKKIPIKTIACGGRTTTFDKFKIAVASEPSTTFCVLLVDSEEPVQKNMTCWQHLKNRVGDGWDCPSGATEDNCHLMIQTMETWLIADKDNLLKFYGKDFKESSLPKRQHIEEVSKESINTSLDQATNKTQKGEYHKTKHGFDILKTAKPDIVREKCPSCDRLFTVLADKMQ